LYVNAEIIANLKNNLHSPYLKSQAELVLSDANRLVKAKPIYENQFSTYQTCTRTLTSHLQCLTAAWVLTKDPKYRKAAIRHMGSLMNWRQVSCEANIKMPHEHEMYFCLSYGEFSADIAVMYDVFRADISKEEQEVFFAVLKRFFLKAALNCVDRPPWWANKTSNWNAVCTGGMGLLALAFYDDLPETSKLIPFVEKSLSEYFKSYIENGGGCPEGTGYWNYGMYYAMRYLLSWENATGKKHPALKIKELGSSLNFPLDFTGITFGDNDGWHPASFFFMLAERMKQPTPAYNAAVHLPAAQERRAGKKTKVANGDHLYAAHLIPTDAQIAKLKKAHQKKKNPVARVYKNMDWGSFADDDAYPTLRMAVRGGSAEGGGHSFMDLLSIRCRVNGELMITDQQDGDYMSSTFSKRAHEIYGRSNPSKSTLFVDGIAAASTCKKTEVVKGKGLLGIRVDGSGAFLFQWKQLFIGRVCLLVDNCYWLVVDHVINPKNDLDKHWVESRFHTFAKTKCGRNGLNLKSGKESLQITFASLQRNVIQQSAGMPSQPLEQSQIYRYMGTEAVHDNFHVTAMNPGTKKLGIAISVKKGVYSIEITQAGKAKRVVKLKSNLTIAG